MKPGEVTLCDNPARYIPAPNPTELEIQRIRECITALESLPDDDARRRVLRYLVSRYVGKTLFV